jgi:hypothetical protein
LKGVESPQTIYQSAINGVTISGLTPTGALVQSQVTGGKKRSGGRAMGKVPQSQKAS